MLILAYFKLITLGEFFSLMFYSFAIFSPLGEIGNVVTKYSETKASLENVQKILAQEPFHKLGGMAPDGFESLEFSGVTYSHPGRRIPRCSTSASPRGRVKAWRSSAPREPGRARSSSSWLGSYWPDFGRILFNGVDSTEVNYDLLRTRVGFVPQSIELFAGTIRDNLKFVQQDATDEDCIASLEAAQLRGLLERSRQGLDTRIAKGD